MKQVADFLMRKYYTKGQIEEAVLTKLLDLNKDKVVVVNKGNQILVVAVFLTLTDETHAKVSKDIKAFTVSSLIEMLNEDGDNLHFILVAGQGVKNILAGMQAVKRERKPKTVSWWNPTSTKMHNYSIN